MIHQIISHMNTYHQDDLFALVKKFANLSCQAISLVGVDTKGLDISCNHKIVRIDFPKEVQENEIKHAIIELCTSISKPTKTEEIRAEILSFRESFQSVIIASLDPQMHAVVSYAPLLRYENRFFIYISQVADHYQSIKSNPNALEVLFLEDESKATSVLLRKRLKYKARAEFREKDSLFETLFDSFESSNPKAGGLKAIRTMADFHLIELFFEEGRYVKGFGGAYNISKEGEIQPITNNPHQFSHK